MTPVRIIAVRELVDQLTSLRFLIISVLAIALTPLAVYVGARDYRERLAEYSRLVAERQRVAKSGAAAVRGIEQSDLSMLRAIREPEPLSIFVRGLDGGLPEYWDFSPTGLRQGPLASHPERLADVLGTLDLEFLIRVVLGLMAILLAFDAVAGEKELGTLRAVLSQPVPRASFLAGKLLGGAVTLVFGVVATFLVAIAAAPAFGIDATEPDLLAKACLMAAGSAIYLVCLFALGLLVSSATASQKTALIVLLVAWVVLVLALTPAATIVAQAISPVAPPDALQAKKRELDVNLRREADVAVGAIYREVTGERRGMWSDKYDAHKQAIDRRWAPVETTYLSKRRRLVREIEEDAGRRSARQSGLARSIMTLSPAAAFSNAAADLAGTGDSTRAAWMQSVREQQSRLELALFDNPPTVILTNDGSSLWVDMRKPPPVADLPAFVPPRRDADTAISRALPSLGLLALYGAVFVTAAFFAFARYDVR